MDTEKQRQRRHDNVRLTESADARSERLLVMPTESLLTNGEWLQESFRVDQNVKHSAGF